MTTPGPNRADAVGTSTEASPAAKISVSILLGAAVLDRYPGALVSIDLRGEDEREPDVVCWNGSALSGGSDVIWVWQVAFPQEDRHHDWNPPLDEQLRMAEADPLAAGRRAVPGPVVIASLIGGNIATRTQGVLAESVGLGVIVFSSFRYAEGSAAAATLDKQVREAADRLADVADRVDVSRDRLRSA